MQQLELIFFKSHLSSPCQARWHGIPFAAFCHSPSPLLLGKRPFRAGSLAIVFSLVQVADINPEFFRMHLCRIPGHTKWDSCLFKLFHQDIRMNFIFGKYTQSVHRYNYDRTYRSYKKDKSHRRQCIMSPSKQNLPVKGLCAICLRPRIPCRIYILIHTGKGREES
jgi:hypothetical protein